MTDFNERLTNPVSSELSAQNGEQTALSRHEAICNCGAGPHATEPYRCARGHTLGGNPLARKNPVNERRLGQLLAKYVRDYQPDTQRLTSMCEQFAAVTEQLESRKADGSANYQRLVQLSQSLGTALEESRTAARATTPPTDLDTLNDDQLIEVTTTILRSLLDLQAQRQEGERLMADASANANSAAEVAPSANEAAPTLGPAPAAPTSEICEYCRPPCVGPEHIAYDVLHARDPEVIRRKDAEATAVMMAQIGKPLPEWCR